MKTIYTANNAVNDHEVTMNTLLSLTEQTFQASINESSNDEPDQNDTSPVSPDPQDFIFVSNWSWNHAGYDQNPKPGAQENAERGQRGLYHYRHQSFEGD